MTLDKNRCVVTGLGMINAIGNSVEECFNNAINSISGIKETKSVDTTDCYAKMGAEVTTCNDLDDVENVSELDRVSKLCLHATKEALKDANLSKFGGNSRVSVIIGSCVGGVVSIEHYYKNNKPASDIAKMPIGAIANEVARFAEAGGVVTNIGNACAAGTISIGYACDLIRSGKADVVIAGGADAFASVPFSGFLALHALDANACSPFNHCSGITLGEGSGILIVESYEHAKARNAKMYCEVLGYGVSSDAHHITAPREDGEGQMQAINWALENSGVKPSEIGYVNAHGTGTEKNDSAEFLSLHSIFDETNDDLSVSSTKAMVGHCLGAAGSIEAVFAIKALTKGIMPPTLGFSDEDLEVLKQKAGKIDFIPNKAREKELTNVMNNSFAFGGNNASIIFSKTAGEVKPLENKKKVAITGFGLVTPLGNDVEKYIENINNNVKVEGLGTSSVGAEDWTKLELKSSFYRKLDVFCQMEAASGMYALKNAGYVVNDQNAFKTGIVVGTSEGALGTGCLFEENIAANGTAKGSAFKFPNTVYNAAGGYLSICSGIKGYNVTLANSAQAGLQGLAYATGIIRDNTAEAMIASGSDENIAITTELYSGLGLVDESALPYENKNGFKLSDGAVSIFIENEEKALERNAKIYAHVAGYGMAHKATSFSKISGSEEGLVNAIKNACQDASINISDISAIVGFANGEKHIDDVEKKALNEVFATNLKNIPVLNIKNRFGEGRAATASLGVVHASLMLSGDIKEDNAYIIDGNNIKQKTIYAKDLNKVLAISYGSGGSYTAIIIER